MALRESPRGDQRLRSKAEVAAVMVGWVAPVLVALIVACFNVTEYFIHRSIHPESTDSSSFLLTWEYVVAMGCGIVEWCVRMYIWPGAEVVALVVVGFAAVVVGLAIRWTAMLTAGPAFHHQIQVRKPRAEQLVTGGIYGYTRHPGYLGFFVFAMGTQLALCNVFATVMFAVVLWRFFDHRIRVEERYLCDQFPGEYERYRGRVGVGIPFIH